MIHVCAVEAQRTRSIGDLMLASVSLYRQRPLLYTVMTACVVATYDITILAVTGHRPFGRPPANFGWSSLDNGTAVLMLTPLAAALLARMITRFDREQGSSPWGAGVGSLRILPIAVIAQVIAYLGIGLAALFFLLPGVVLWVRWFVVAPAIAVEGRSVVGALRRSAQLTANRYWHILGVLGILWVLVLVTTLCVHVVVAGSTTGGGVVLFEVVVQAILTSYMALMTALLYFDLSTGQKVDGVMRHA
jgi:hypothetical protein